MAVSSKSPAEKQDNAKIDIENVIDPVELAKMEKSVLGIEQSPPVAAQTPGKSQWTASSTNLGPPFDSERVNLAQMRQLRKDPMIAFALHYRKVPIARAEWYVEARDKNGINRQVGAFVDASIRRIYARYVFQRTLCLDFGYQAIVKNWTLANPGGVYLDPTQENPEQMVQPVWNEGNILPKIWKAPTALRPELVAPVFDTKTQDFAGITYTVPTTTAAQDATSTKGGRAKAKAKGTMDIDVYHALWATNQKDSEHGSIYGYPLTGFARDYWWTYKFLLGLANRAYERLAIPPIVALYPQGSTVVDSVTGARRANWEIALEMAERLRSNAVAAVPSTMAEAGVGETSATQRAWDFKFLETPTSGLSIFNDRFNYLNVMKLRSVWVPDLAFIGGSGAGGNSAGNIAEQMAEVFTQSQQLLMEEICDEINRYMIPQLLWLNFPEFVNAGGRAEMKSRGFRKDDMDMLKQIIQLFGQADPTTMAQIDTTELLRRAGLPLLSPEEYVAVRERMATQATSQVPNVPGVTVANPQANAGSTNGGSQPEPSSNGVAAGFSDAGGDYIYIQPPERIDLEFAEVDDFLSNLPTSKHYSDKTIRALAVQLRRLWSAHWRRLYPDFANFLDKDIVSIELEDNGSDFVWNRDGWFFAADKKRAQVSKTKAEKAAKKLIQAFGIDAKTLKTLTTQSAVIMRKIVNRSIKLDTQSSGLTPTIDEEAIDTFLSEQTGRLIKLTHQTFLKEIQQHLVNEIREGKTAGEIADGLIARFETMPMTKAERIARSETRDAVNAGTLITGEGAGIRYTKMLDGEAFDKDCADRNGKLATIKEAWKQMRKEHPYGTLGFQLMPRADFSIEYVGSMPDGHDDVFAYFDDSTGTAYIYRELDGDAIDDYLVQLSDVLCSNGNGRR